MAGPRGLPRHRGEVASRPSEPDPQEAVPMKKVLALAVSMVFVLSAALVWAQPLPSARPEQVGFSPERLAHITAAFRSEVDKGQLPGAVVVIARKGKIAYFESVGFRDKTAGTPMTNDTIFRIYSMTKPLASVAAMILVEDGKIQLTDPISKFLPPMKNLMVSVPKPDATYARLTYALVPAEREPTVQDLLRHTAGLAYYEITTNAPVKEAYVKTGFYDPKAQPFDQRDMTPMEYVDRLAKAPLSQQPGRVWEYSVAVEGTPSASASPSAARRAWPAFRAPPASSCGRGTPGRTSGWIRRRRSPRC